MITREDMADLRAGDVIRIVSTEYPGWHEEGPLRGHVVEGDTRLYLGAHLVRFGNGSVALWLRPEDHDHYSLVVVRHALRPLHDCPDCKHLLRQETGS